VLELIRRVRWVDGTSNSKRRCAAGSRAAGVVTTHDDMVVRTHATSWSWSPMPNSPTGRGALARDLQRLAEVEAASTAGSRGQVHFHEVGGTTPSSTCGTAAASRCSVSTMSTRRHRHGNGHGCAPHGLLPNPSPLWSACSKTSRPTGRHTVSSRQPTAPPSSPPWQSRSGPLPPIGALERLRCGSHELDTSQLHRSRRRPGQSRGARSGSRGNLERRWTGRHANSSGWPSPTS